MIYRGENSHIDYDSVTGESPVTHDFSMVCYT